jgi:hypothetical protein
VSTIPADISEWYLGGMITERRNERCSDRETMPNCMFAYQKFHMDWPSMELGLWQRESRGLIASAIAQPTYEYNLFLHSSTPASAV